MVANFSKLMVSLFQIWMNCEMKLFLGLHVKQTRQGTFLHQEKYTSELLKKYSPDKCASSKVPTSFGTKMYVDPWRESIDQ